MLAMPQVLHPGTINDVISQLDVINDRLQSFFLGGGGRDSQSGRNFAYDVFNDSREVGGGRMPGTPPSRVKPQLVGTVRGAFPRWHESIPLLYEDIHNIRQIGSMAVDTRGESYILKQERYLSQRATNHKEFQFAAMIRGKYYYTQDGDDLNVSLSSGAAEVDFQVPAGNKSQLNMLGAGDIIGVTWATASTDIPADLFQINAAFEQLIGRQLNHVWMNSATFQYVLNNDKVKALAGTANVVFDSFNRVGKNDFECKLKGLPMFTFHITDGLLNLSGTPTKLFANDEVMFCPEPDPTWIQYGEGSEIVVEYPGAAPTERFGAYFWAEPTTKPAGYELIGVLNGIPFLYNPYAIAFADVVP